MPASLPETPGPDWALRVSLGGLFLLYAVFGATGYGTDNDIYEMLRTGADFFRDGTYRPSRSPGYPLPEMVVTACARLGGHWLSNGVAALLGCLTLACFYTLVKEGFGRGKALLSMLAAGLNPHWIVAASSSMDYVYAAAFFLAGLVLLRRGRVMPAALCFAACVASRATYLPLGALAYLVAFLRPPAEMTRPRLALSAGLFAALSLGVYLAVYLAAGAGMFQVYTGRPVPFFSWVGYDSPHEYFGRYVYKNVFLWGAPAFLALAAAAALTVWRGGEKGRRSAPWITAGVWAALAYCQLLFLRLPLEISYLLPVLFLGLWLLNAARRARVFLALLIAGHLVYGWVSPDLLRIQYAAYSLEGNVASGAAFGPALNPGVLAKNLGLRRYAEDYYAAKFRLQDLQWRPGRVEGARP